ncbi:MAG: alpha amylase C-terminal domain-containing protein [Bacteroidales bacterium]|nr:alpha amylase C-terminal domain-containing protein [Bacteroidales bacterium]
MNSLKIVKNDPWLEPYNNIISNRIKFAYNKEKELTGNNSLSDFATGYLYFGLHREDNLWVFREWAPNAVKIYLIGNFNNWEEKDEFRFQEKDNGIWELKLPLEKIHHKVLYKLSIYWKDGKGERIPAWSKRVIQDEKTLIFSSQLWQAVESYNWKNDSLRKAPETPLIYEAHIGMATEEEKVGSFDEFRLNVLPRIKKAGYNVIQLMAIQEHPYYGSFGYHVSNFFAVSSRFGTPCELKKLIDEAHGMGIMIIMDLVHSHSVKNEIEGLAKYDGTPYQFFHDGNRREHVAWDSLCFDYSKNEVLHFLLSNIKFWLEEYHFDGFRFDGVTSMLYLDHGLSRDFSSYNDYFDGQQDEDAITYFILANKLIHEVNPEAISIAEEMSGYPGLATPIKDGGLGFDYRLAMGIPDFWIKLIKELPDEKWNIKHIYHELTNKRAEEKTISYAESHDQALVGDKTIIFRLIDKEMYYSMDIDSQNLLIDRGIALHKIIRLITLATSGGGYLNFMGNEFGHPEWIDFPREGNNWSYKYARRQWRLADDNTLRYNHLLKFDEAMIKLVKDEKIFNDISQSVWENENDQILIFKRGGLLFVFNFNPVQSFSDYGIPVNSGKFKIVLSSDSKIFGGFDRIDEKITYYTIPEKGFNSQHYLKLYIPARTAIVLKRIQITKVKY